MYNLLLSQTKAQARREFLNKNQVLLTFLLMIFFWSIFDGLSRFATPLIIIQNGISAVHMGLIIGSASIFGALFDFGLSKFVAKPSYRRIFFSLFATSSLFPLFLFNAGQSIWLYLLAMACWGLDYDLRNFGSFSLIANKYKAREATRAFGLNHLFLNLGFILGPAIGALLIMETVQTDVMLSMYGFLLIALAFFVVLFFSSPFKLRGLRKMVSKPKPEKNQVKKWMNLSVSSLWPAFILSAFSLFQAGAYWVVGPLLAEQFDADGGMAAVTLISSRTMAFLLGGLIVSTWAPKFSGLKASQICFLISSVLLFLIYLVDSSVIIFLLLFLSSLFASFVGPLSSGFLSDAVQANPQNEKNIQGLNDFYMNVGLALGPIVAGFFAQNVDYHQAMGLIGFFGIFSVITLSNWNLQWGQHRNKLHLLKEGKLFGSSKSRFDLV